MALSACPRCNAMFNKGHSLVCLKCEPEEQQDSEKIREVLARIPNLNAAEIAEEADVPRDCVVRMIDQGLIQNVTVNAQVRCGRCGAPAISISKKLCQTCLEKLNVELAREQSKVKLAPKKITQVGDVMGSVRKTLDQKRSGR